jgi:hypothetical protein
MNLKRSLIVGFVFIFILSSSVLAEIVVFDRYDTRNTLSDGVLKVEKNIVLKNAGRNPIIPGEIHFKVYEFEGKNQIPSKIENLDAHNNYNRLTSKVVREDDFSDIVVDIWNPLLSDFEFPLTISYEINYNQKGVLFHELNFPDDEVTVPLAYSVTRLMLPDKYFVTYAPGAKIVKDGDFRVLEWENPEQDIVLEYTRIPLPKMPFKFVTFFWMMIITVLVVITVYYNFLYKKK